jgi:sec-independent protein translocase protein TatB
VGSVGAPEVLVILILALLVLGPERLPQAARTLGRWVGEVRRITGSLQAEVQDVVDEVMRPVNETATVATDSFTSTFSSSGEAAPVEADGATTAASSVAEVEARLPADVPLLPAPPADPSLN